jgi:hypothetical protein
MGNNMPVISLPQLELLNELTAVRYFVAANYSKKYHFFCARNIDEKHDEPG